MPDLQVTVRRPAKSLETLTEPERGGRMLRSADVSWCDVCATVLTRGKAIDFLLAGLAAVVVLARGRVELPLLDVARDADGVVVVQRAWWGGCCQRRLLDSSP